MPSKQYKRTLLPQLLDAAKCLKPRHWQDLERPTLKEWCNKITDMQDLEYLRFSDEEGLAEFEEEWKKWSEYKYSMRFAEVMGV